MKVFLFGLIALLCSHAMAHDGAWNGKRWERDRLFAGVADGDPDALAEWAYCSRKVLLGIAYDADLIYARAKEAADKGSLFGRSLVGLCYQDGIAVDCDPEFAVSVLKDSASQGCGYGSALLALSYTQGKGLMRDSDKAYEVAMLHAPEEARLRRAVISGVHQDKKSRFWNLTECADCWIEGFEKNGDIHDASLMLFLEREKRRYYSGGIDKEVLDRAAVRVMEGVLLGHGAASEHAVRMLDWSGSERYSALITLSLGHSGDGYALSKLAEGASRSPSSRSLVLTKSDDGDPFWDRAFRAGETPHQTARIAHRWYDYRQRESPRREYATRLLKRVINRADPDGHGKLGYCLLYIHCFHRPNPVELNKKRGIAHLIYASADSPYCEYLLAWYFFRGGVDDRCLDLVQGMALTRATLNRSGHGKDREVLKRWAKEKMELLNAEQKVQVEELLKRGFPRSNEFRRPAFELLKEVGDLAPNAKFVSAKPLRKEERWDR